MHALPLHLIGMGLGIADSAMGFAWSPAREPEPGLPTAAERHAHAGGRAAVALLLTLGGPAAVERAPAPGAVEVPRVPPTVTTTLFAPNGFPLAGVRTGARRGRRTPGGVAAGPRGLRGARGCDAAHRRSPVRWLYGLVGVPGRHWKAGPEVRSDRSA
ncbi:hypothetical protein ACFVYD_27775 [Streptomyces sp. NPDC058301]|uniref:hypothetical protein n=1 Tax=Streptomyces sp. NPDC058301 TaxID=3346436 RepID=UPI0036E5361E